MARRGGVAALEPARPMTSETSLPFASVTKVATAALALRLAEQGRLSLEDPIRRWFPAWRGDAAATVHDLLGHTSGMGDAPDSFFAQLERHPRRVVSDRDFVAASPRPGPRTDQSEYSNAGFMIAGRILSRAAERPVAAAMRREVFAAPGGDGLALQPAERPHPPLAHSYWYPRGFKDPADLSDGSGLLPTRSEAMIASTAGALAGDVPSLARWGHHLLGGTLLEPDSLREMRRFRLGAFWTGYGLGLARWSEGDHELWGHSGDGFGSASELWHVPEDDVTIALAWNDDLLAGPDAPFLSALLRVVLGPE